VTKVLLQQFPELPKPGLTGINSRNLADEKSAIAVHSAHVAIIASFINLQYIQFPKRANAN